jgi:regulator of sigma E protease
MSSWLLVVLGFMLLVVLHELGHFSVAKLVGMRVEKFSLFFPPTLVSKKIGETEYAIGAIPAGGYVKISGMNPDEDLPEEVRDRAYHAQPVWKRIAVIAAGPMVNLVLALVLLFVFFAAIGQTTASTKVGEITKGYPAASALKTGDRVVSVDGARGGPERISRRIASHRCASVPPTKGCQAARPAQLVVNRDGQTVNVSARPIYDPVAKRTRLGFAYAPGPRQTLSAGNALTTSLDSFWFITKQTASLPARIFNAKQRKEISGVVGVSKVASDTIKSDIADAVSLLAIVSLSLAIVNLFPFLPLDGGHIFWAVVEKVRRRPVPLAVMERAGVIGFMLVIGLFVLGLTNDIGRLTGEGFQVR